MPRWGNAAIIGVVPPEYFTEAVSQSLDLDRYITYFAVEAVSSVMDGFSFHNNNTYLYDNPKDGRFALLPTPNPSGNFTKITQRVPVKIVLVEKPRPLTPGMMVEVGIDVR